MRRDDAIWVLPLGAAVLAAGVWLSIAATMLAIALQLLPWASGTIKEFRWPLVAACGGAVAFAACVWTRRQLIIRSIRNNMERAKCPYCWFSLMGLPVKEGTVQCPECGERMSLHELHLLPEDLQPPSRPKPNPPPVSPLGTGAGRTRPRKKADSRG